jgi:hypothetical protein
MCFAILTIIDLQLELLGIIAVIREQFTDSGQNDAQKFLTGGLACHSFTAVAYFL